MNDFDLESKLKSVPVPERTEEYWENFPSQVRFQLRRAAPPQPSHARFVWKFGVSFACLVVGLFLSQPLKAASGAFFQKEQFVQRQLAALPGHLRVLMDDEHGLHYLVADKE